MSWKKETLITQNGLSVQAQYPIIVSASRSTDIPAFYADWFFHRLKVGYSIWTNPFSGEKSYVAYRDTRFIVFWSKNPRNLIPHLDKLCEKNIGCYIQFTLNDYVEEGLEKGVPSVKERVQTFKELVRILGKGHVIWRFDPLVLTDKITIDDLLRKIESIGDSLVGYTEKLVFSFVDISLYRRVESNLKKNGINYHEWTLELMEEFTSRLSALNKKWGYTLATCGEKIDLDKHGVAHNKCIDDDLIIRLASNDPILMDFLDVKVESQGFFGVPDGAILLDDGRYALKNKSKTDKGQRQFCHCIDSKDIGEYNTCAHLCEYCYANSSKESALSNLARHRKNPDSETITGL